MELDKYRYPKAIIETAVRLFHNEHLTYRKISEKMKSMGVIVSHKTVFSWVQVFSNRFNLKKRNCKPISSYYIEEDEITCNGEPLIMYRAVGDKDETINICVYKKKNIGAAKRYFLNVTGK